MILQLEHFSLIEILNFDNLILKLWMRYRSY